MRTSKTLLKLLSLLILCTNACKDGSYKSELPIVNFETANSRKQDVLLSDVVEDFKVIQLETTENCLIGSRNVNVIFSNDFLFVSQSRTPLLVFNSEGKFIRSIGRIGRGPEEIDDNYNFTLNPSDSSILFFSSSRKSITVYSISGDFLRDINIGYRPFAVKCLNDNLLYANLILFPNEDTLGFNHIIFNHLGEIEEKYSIKGYTLPNLLESSGPVAYMTPIPVILTLDNEVYIYSAINDTIFKINESRDLSPRLTWDKGKYSPPGGLSAFYSMNASETENYVFELGDFGKIGAYWFFGVPFPKNYSLVFFDELKNESFVLSKMINDIDGTIWTLPHFGKSFNNTFATLYNPLDLKKMMQSGRFDNDSVKYPDRNKAFKEMINSLEENDNPIAGIFTLKR